MLRRVPVIPASSTGEVVRALERLGAVSVIADLEPLACPWGTGDAALRSGLASLLDALSTVPTLSHVAVVTNSHRVPSVAPERAGLVVTYRHSAGKPRLALDPFRSLPRPVVVVGDQRLTDGLFAWRLQVPLVEISLPAGAPQAIRAQRLIGRVLTAPFFARTG